MKREEEIEKQGTIYSDISGNYIEWGDGWQDYDDQVYVEKAFIEGAKWADKTMIDRACEWLKEHIDLYSYNAFNTKSCYTEIKLTDVFETAFRQAMES